VHNTFLARQRECKTGLVVGTELGEGRLEPQSNRLWRAPKIAAAIFWGL